MSTYANQYMGTSNENDIDPSIINLNRVMMQVWMEKNCPEMIPTKTVEVPVEVTKEISVQVPVVQEISVQVPVEVVKEISVEVTKEVSVEITS